MEENHWLRQSNAIRKKVLRQRRWRLSAGVSEANILTKAHGELHDAIVLGQAAQAGPAPLPVFIHRVDFNSLHVESHGCSPGVPTETPVIHDPLNGEHRALRRAITVNIVDERIEVALGTH